MSAGLIALLIGFLGLAVGGGSSSSDDDGDREPVKDPEEPTDVVDVGAAAEDTHPLLEKDDSGEAETLTGGPGPDLLSALDDVPDGGDTIFGGEGDDRIWADSGDTVTGGEGGDRIYVPITAGADGPVVITDLDFSAESDIEDADRVIFVDENGAVIPREAFFDGSLAAGIGDLPGGAGAAFYVQGEVVAVFENQEARDLFYNTSWLGNFQPHHEEATGEGEIFRGTTGNDNLQSTPQDDVIRGWGGADIIDGRAGDDYLEAPDAGNDPAMADILIGGEGWDTLRGDEGDLLIGLEGRDSYEIVVPPPEGGDPVMIHGYELASEDGLPETITLVAPGGDPLSAAEVAKNLVVGRYEDGPGAALIYEGVTVGVVLDIDPDELGATSTWVGNFATDSVAKPEQPLPLPGVQQPSQPSDETLELDLTLQSLEETGEVVTDQLFGGNAVFNINTEGGAALETFMSAIDELGVELLRFPAGRGDGNEMAVDGENFLNVVEMSPGQNGMPELRPELTDFLDWARDPDGDGDFSDARQVTLVIPTKFLTLEDYEAFGDEIEAWATAIAEEYGDVVEAVEIGNEYWGYMGEAEYGAKANIAANALADGFAAGGLTDDAQPDILVQMGVPNTGSDFHTSRDDRPWSVRLEAANQAIIDGLEDGARDAIDGVIEHYYYRQDDLIFADNAAETNYIAQEYRVWDEAFDKELDLWVTEWNVRTSNYEESGIRSGGVMVEQFENLQELGADAAHVWPAQHNTDSDLVGGPRAEPILDDEGRIVSTIRGATFDLMEDTLIGMELMEAEFAGDDGAVEINVWQDDDKTVVFVISRVPEEMDLDIDFSEFVPEAADVSGVKIGMDRSPISSDGVHFVYGSGFTESDYVLIDGRPYYLNEHDVRAELTDYTFDGTELEFGLLPFEVMMVTFTHSPAT
ncbi:calcium-binding protein [Vannielia litorea]|uniref:calcium-binding protein n=1 Tax=Vannielia litorea TaxID=1217970 RepID=UPI001BCFFF68|nr:calcium-binding protein [Vannielia litorea]MBS8225465.1 calcium-binding protein [Vannielia litorea]